MSDADREDSVFTYKERPLLRCLFLSGMHWGKVGYIIGSIQGKDEAIMEMFDYIAHHQDLEPAGLYKEGKRVIQRYKCEKLEDEE